MSNAGMDLLKYPPNEDTGIPVSSFAAVASSASNRLIVGKCMGAFVHYLHCLFFSGFSACMQRSLRRLRGKCFASGSAARPLDQTQRGSGADACSGKLHSTGEPASRGWVSGRNQPRWLVLRNQPTRLGLRNQPRRPGLTADPASMARSWDPAMQASSPPRTSLHRRFLRTSPAG
jgi:hypothetical protein